MNLIKNKVHSVIDETSLLTIKPVFEDFHELIMNGTYEYPRHCHSNYEIIIVKNGPYLCNLNNIEIKVDSNQFLIVKPGDWHQDHLYNNQTHYVLHFNIEYMAPISSNKTKLLKDSILPYEQVFKIKHNWNPAAFFSNMHTNNNINDLFTFNIQESLMQTFFWNMIRSISNDLLSEFFQKIMNKQFFQERLFRLFNKNYNKSITVEIMSFELNMSRRKLTYYCKDFFNESPARLFNRYKLNKAINLLSLGTYSISEISEILGYDNQFHFSRVFKRYFNTSPSQYKLDKNLVPVGISNTRF